MLWRRSYDTPPPPISDDNEYSQAGDPRYADLGDDAPKTECLADVVARMESVPVRPDLRRPARPASTVLVAAHGNSLRAVVKLLDGISDEGIAKVNLPTGIPLRYELDADLRADQRRWRLPRPGGRGRGDHGGGQPGPVTACGRPASAGMVVAG